MPAAAGKLLDLLGVPADERDFATPRRRSSASRAGTPLPAPEPVFPRYVEPETEAAA